jgi:hypothetical protein
MAVALESHSHMLYSEKSSSFEMDAAQVRLNEEM